MSSGKRLRRRLISARAVEVEAAVRGDDSKVKATIHVRSLAEEEGITCLVCALRAVRGTITREDVRAWITLNREPKNLPAASEAQAEQDAFAPLC